LRKSYLLGYRSWNELIEIRDISTRIRQPLFAVVPGKECMPKVVGVLTSIVVVLVFCTVIARAGTAEGTSTAVRHRQTMEQAARDNPFLLLSHRPNYILPVTYNLSPNDEPFGLEEGTLDEVEMKFQVSLKVQLGEGVFGDRGSLYAAYTNRSWWQTYNADKSRPFRETNHEPELFLLFDIDRKFLGFKATNVIIGASHQSNGQGGSLSRSWNRIYGMLVLEKGNMVLSLKPWYRIPEDKKEAPDDPRGDDNPDIMDYMGSGEVGLFYRMQNHSFSMMARNNLSGDNKGALELGWTYPLSSRLKGYLQFFDGYGESLIDYDHRTTRLGVGFLLADWL
jgi:phospholipase A1